MPAVTGPITGKDAKIYIQKDFAKPAQMTLANLKGNGKLVAAENLVAKATLVGDIAQTANTEEEGFYGEDSKGTSVGQATNDPVEFTIQYNPANALHRNLSKTWAIGSDVGLALDVVRGGGNTIIYIDGQLASRTLSPPLDEKWTLAVTIAPKAEREEVDSA